MTEKRAFTTAKIIQTLLKNQFRDIERYIDFFDKNIELEKQREAATALRYDDKIFQNIAKYHSHISIPDIHSKSLLIFIHSSFEQMLCLMACWISIGHDGGSKIPSLKGFPEARKYLEIMLVDGDPFHSEEWKRVEDFRLIRNHFAHGGNEGIIGVKGEDRYVLAAREINRKFDETFHISEFSGRFKIKPEERAVRTAVSCYKDFLFLLGNIAKASG